MTRKSEYSELLRDPRWQKLRLEVFQRDNFACRFCGDKESMLAVHHVRYTHGKKPWEYDLRDLLTLCKDCHEQEFAFRDDYERDLLYLLRKNAISASDLQNFFCALGGKHDDSPYFPLVVESLTHVLYSPDITDQLLLLTAHRLAQSPHHFLSELSRKFLQEKNKQSPQDER